MVKLLQPHRRGLPIRQIRLPRRSAAQPAARTRSIALRCSFSQPGAARVKISRKLTQINAAQRAVPPTPNEREGSPAIGTSTAAHPRVARSFDGLRAWLPSKKEEVETRCSGNSE